MQEVLILILVIHNYLHSGDTQKPVHLRVGPQQLYVVQGADNIRTLWKSSSLCTNSNFYYALRFLLGISERSGKRYLADDSGATMKPRPTSRVVYQPSAVPQFSSRLGFCTALHSV
jgi:hypothetical protein